jgi:hypothetical protein
VLEDGLSSGHASDNENNNPVSSSNDIYNKRNGSIASSTTTTTISTIQKQYQENLVQTHANNNTFYTNNNNNNSILLNNGDLEQPTSKVHLTQSPLSYHHPYYAMRYDTTSSNNTTANSASIKEPPSTSSLRYDTVNSVGSKELTTSRYDNNNKEHSRESSLLNPSHNSLLNNNKIFKNRDPELESLYTISKYAPYIFLNSDKVTARYALSIPSAIFSWKMYSLRMSKLSRLPRKKNERKSIS